MKKCEIDISQRLKITDMVNNLTKVLERIAEESDVTLRDVTRLREMQSELISIAKLDTSYWVNDDSQIYRNSYKYVLILSGFYTIIKKSFQH